VHDYSLPGNLFYSFDDTNVRRQNISGLAPALYFRTVAFQATLSFLLVLLLLFGYFLPSLGKESAFLPQIVPDGKLGQAQQMLSGGSLPSAYAAMAGRAAVPP